jgi:hypothetical protein
MMQRAGDAPPPAPFFETACPRRWQDALDEVWATPFRLAVPGHGAPMTRDAFDTYRGAFKRFRACVETSTFSERMGRQSGLRAK